MRLPFFRRTGILYVPGNIVGWLIMSAGIIFAVYRFIDIDRKSHSASDTLRPFLINLLIIFIVYTLIAYSINSFPKNKKNKPG